MDISKDEEKKINEFFNKENGQHFIKAFDYNKSPYKISDLEWYKKEQEKKYGV